AKSIAFENTAGPGGAQAVALRVAGNYSAFFNCAFRGYQDTLYVDQGHQFYRNCEIAGTIDFIYGQSSTLIQNSTILVRNPAQGQQNVVVADGTFQFNKFRTGIVLQNCSIIPDVDLKPYLQIVKTYLARPWKPFSTAVFINNYIDGFVQPEGYMIWNETHPNTENSYFAEFGNIGPVAKTTTRVKWAKGLISKKAASI
ncbi:putative pectinesterase/pectinesterase inhibitor 21-like, partial [Trifolium medium]|nr:putative pectinesterase/pectinesterase inhibitor 21-like [Trifolium medium]